MSPLEKLFTSTPSLPSIPRVVQELIATLGNEDADIGGLIKEVRQDQSLAARVLRLANSSYYGVSHKVGAIDEAVTLIGLNALRTLVIASGVTGAFTNIEGIDLKKFWCHSMLTGGIARRIGRRAQINGEFAYTAGLMHGIGQLLIHMAYPDAGRDIARDCRNLSVAERAAIEDTRIGTNHCEASAELGRRWNFPAIIQNALRWYVTPLEEEACPYAAAVYLAVHIAFGLEAGQSPTEIARSLPHSVIDKLALEPSIMEEEIEQSLALQEESANLV